MLPQSENQYLPLWVVAYNSNDCYKLQPINNIGVFISRMLSKWYLAKIQNKLHSKENQDQRLLDLGTGQCPEADSLTRECLSLKQEEKVQVDEQYAGKKIISKLYSAAQNSLLNYNIRGKGKERYRYSG